MKVAVTVTAEFPPEMPSDVIEKLARESASPAFVRGASVTHIELTSSEGYLRRRLIEWKNDCVDVQDTDSNGVFQAQLAAAAERGIRLARTIRKLEPDGRPGEEMANTMSWSWDVKD